MTTRMDLGTITSWRCSGCPQNGNHPKAVSAQEHADSTGHNVSAIETTTWIVFPAGSPPVPIEMIPGEPA